MHMKYLISFYSVLVGKAFAFTYARSFFSAKTVFGLLEHYKNMRRRLPLMECGNHWGNHAGSSYRPFLATQGE